jgi:hypothetical protein
MFVLAGYFIVTLLVMEYANIMNRLKSQNMD